MKIKVRRFIKEIKKAWYCCFDRAEFGEVQTCYVIRKNEYLGVDNEQEPLFGELKKIIFKRVEDGQFYTSIDYEILNDENIEYDNGRYKITGTDIPPFYLFGVMKLK